jgi:predicted PurR-regulated permease PerM
MNESPNLPQKNVQAYVFGIILILLFILVCRLFAPFFTVLLWSTLLYVLISPLHQRILKKVNLSTTRGKFLKTFWAAVFAIGTVVVILLPLFFVVLQFFRQILELIHFAQDTLNARPGVLRTMLRDFSAFIENLSSGQIQISADEIERSIFSLLSSSLQNLLQISGGVARNVGYFFLNLAFMIFCLFFFYTDGTYLSHLALRAIPIRKEYLSALVGKFKDITRNLFFGYIMVSLIQAVLAYIIFTIFQVKGALVFAALTLICVLIPMVGGGLVWLPLGIVRIVGGDLLGGVIFLLVSGIFISTLDNFLRPFFLQNRIQLHPLIIFFAILGGVWAFGFNGLILGPMAVILFLTVLDLFLTEHKIEHQE